MKRSGGVLLHPTSLPGPFGIGDLGPAAHAFVDWLADSGSNLWQVLPLGPTGYGNSPYQCHSVFAGNTNLISPEQLVRDGFLSEDALIDAGIPRGGRAQNRRRVDFASVIPWKRQLLARAFHRFRESGTREARAAFDAFLLENRWWLDDFALFMALKERHSGASWTSWPEDLRKPTVWRDLHRDEQLQISVTQYAFGQMVFFQQWADLREHAHLREIQIIGDVPIFAAEDSADVWAHPELFLLDAGMRPLVVAGVPPDYFAPTGQLWGNPLYRWSQHEATRYAWWSERLRAVLRLVDLVRLDHFRGLAAYWEVPSGAPTAENGRWMPGPGSNFITAMLKVDPVDRRSAGRRIIAEDLGVVTPDVRDLLTRYQLPGMRVLQFGLAGHSRDFLPDRYTRNCVAYTGTHDNDTARGWFSASSEMERRLALKYLGTTEAQVVEAMVRAVWESAAEWAVVPMQDALDLDTEARMNFPGKPQGNWEWRLDDSALTAGLATRLRALNADYSRGISG